MASTKQESSITSETYPQDLNQLYCPKISQTAEARLPLIIIIPSSYNSLLQNNELVLELKPESLSNRTYKN